jgi:hypothetical protein
MCSGEDGDVSGPELVWKIFEPSPSLQPKGIVSSGDGGFVIAMDIEHLIINDTDGSLFQNIDVGLIKVDSQGMIIWEKSYGDENISDTRNFIIASEVDGYLVAGYKYGILPEDVGLPYLLRVDGSGDKLWEDVYPHELSYYGSSYGFSCGVLCNKGGFALAGGGRSVGYLRFLRIDDDGENIWEKSYSIDFDLAGFVESVDGGFVIAGTRQTVFGEKHAVLLKIDGSGNKVWEKWYGGWGSGSGIIGA